MAERRWNDWMAARMALEQVDSGHHQSWRARERKREKRFWLVASLLTAASVICCVYACVGLLVGVKEWSSFCSFLCVFLFPSSLC